MDYKCGTNNRYAQARLSMEKESNDGFYTLVSGVIREESTNEPIPLAKVKIIAGGIEFINLDTDFDGSVEFEIAPGEYSLEIQLVTDTVTIEELTFCDHSKYQIEILITNY